MANVLNQITPFNKHRFNECMTWFTRYAGKSLSQYDLVKLHVLTDVFHVMTHGSPVIGGALNAWDLGPVVPLAYNLIDHWAHRARESPEQEHLTDYFRVTPGAGKINDYTSVKEPDLEDFSDSEMECMVLAWSVFSKLRSKSAREEYFHNSSFLGKAWQAARDEQREEMSWDDLIDEYAVEKGLSDDRVASLKRAIRL